MKYLLIMALCIFCAISCLTKNVSADAIKGTVDSVDPAAATIVVGGIFITTQNGRVENEVGQVIMLQDIAAGNFVAVEGYFSGPGRFDAYKTSKDYPGNDEITARIEAIDIEQKKIFIRGVEIDYTEALRVEDEDGISMDLDLLTKDLYVECRGQWIGPLKLLAKKIRKE